MCNALEVTSTIIADWICFVALILDFVDDQKLN